MPAPPDPALTLGLLVERCDATVESLLLALPSTGDRLAQAAVDGYLDAVMDLLRMLAAAAREGAGRLPTAPVSQAAPHVAAAPPWGMP